MGEDTIFVEVTEKQTFSSLRGYNMSTSQVFNFTFQDIFGNTKDAFKMKLVCNWYNNGANSYINNLEGTYTVLDNSFRCEWDVSGETPPTPTYHNLTMYAYHNGGRTWYSFVGYINTVGTSAEVNFNYVHD